MEKHFKFEDAIYICLWIQSVISKLYASLHRKETRGLWGGQHKQFLKSRPESVSCVLIISVKIWGKRLINHNIHGIPATEWEWPWLLSQCALCKPWSNGISKRTKSCRCGAETSPSSVTDLWAKPTLGKAEKKTLVDSDFCWASRVQGLLVSEMSVCRAKEK